MSYQTSFSVFSVVVVVTVILLVVVVVVIIVVAYERVNESLARACGFGHRDMRQTPEGEMYRGTLSSTITPT